MKRTGFCLLLLSALAACGGDDEGAGGLTADEERRLENIADRLDEDALDFNVAVENGQAAEANPAE
jgi:hypothetical protein